jgi:hypothetical protein
VTEGKSLLNTGNRNPTTGGLSLGRSTRKDGRVDNAPTVQADDVHAVIEALGTGPGRDVRE